MESKILQSFPLDQLWLHIKNFFKIKPRGRPPIHDRRRILAAILYVSKTGCQWRMLPSNFPPYQTVYHYFRKWTNDGLWRMICKKLRAIARKKSTRYRYSQGVCIDSQSVKTFYGSGAVGFDGNKKVKGRKRHMLVDSLGFLIAVICMQANIHDIKGGKMLLNFIKNEADLDRVKYIHADSAYIGLKKENPEYKIEISGLKKTSEFTPFPMRWKVERSIAWTRGQRRTIVDYEKKVRYSQAWIYICFIQLMAKRLKQA